MRRKNILMARMGSPPAQAASMLKDKAALFKHADDNLFGKEFREQRDKEITNDLIEIILDDDKLKD